MEPHCFRTSPRAPRPSWPSCVPLLYTRPSLLMLPRHIHTHSHIYTHTAHTLTHTHIYTTHTNIYTQSHIHHIYTTHTHIPHSHIYTHRPHTHTHAHIRTPPTFICSHIYTLTAPVAKSLPKWFSSCLWLSPWVPTMVSEMESIVPENKSVPVATLTL